MKHMFALLFLTLSEPSGSNPPPTHESNQKEKQVEEAEKQEEEEEPEMPIGYRFSPKDHELIVHFLVNRVLGHPLPINHISDIDPYEHDPDQLPFGVSKNGSKDKMAFFFTNIQQCRTTKNGYWKATGGDEQVFHGKVIVGFKKAFTFYWGKEPNGEKSHWIMNEYRVNPCIIPIDALNDSINAKIERCIVCRLQIQEEEGKSGWVTF